MTPDARTAILIVSWSAREHLARALRSLAALPYHTVVVDNASDDGSADLVAREFPTVTLVRAATNLGFAGGVNRARRETDAGYLLLLNPDATATGDAIATLAAALDADPGVGAVGGQLRNADGTPQHGFQVRRFPTLASLAVDLLLVDKLWPDNPISRRYFARDLAAGDAADVDQPAAACLMVRAALFDRLGGMDERFHPAWFEDVDLCRRIRTAGFRIRYEPRAVFAHHGGIAMRALGLGRFSSIWYENMERYVRKHHGAAAWLTTKLLIALGMLARAAISLTTGDRGSATAYTGVLRQTLARWTV